MIFFVVLLLGLNIKCECSSMVEFQPSKLVAWVRFPSLAPIRAHSSVDRVPGYEPVGRRFESSWARQKGLLRCKSPFYFYLAKNRQAETCRFFWRARQDSNLRPTGS